MSNSTKAISYADLVCTMNAHDMQVDLDEACKHLSLSALTLMEKFDYVGKLLHSVDILGAAPPFKQRWSVLNKSFRDLIWHFRSNAGFISARLTMFCTTVLPLTARNSSSSRSHDEKLQCLRSFMTISGEHAALTRNLVTNAMKFNNALNAFHTDFAKFVSQKSGQRELRDLTQKLADLENTVQKLCLSNGKVAGHDVTHYAFTVFHLTSTCKRKCSRSRPSHRRLPLNSADLSTIGRLYEQLDVTKNEVAHAQYNAQVSHRKADAISAAQTTMSSLVSDEMATMESGLSLFLSVWSCLQADCAELLQWLQTPKSHPEVPLVIVSMLDTSHNLYATMAGALDVCVVNMDPAHFATKP